MSTVTIIMLNWAPLDTGLGVNLTSAFHTGNSTQYDETEEAQQILADEARTTAIQAPRYIKHCGLLWLLTGVSYKVLMVQSLTLRSTRSYGAFSLISATPPSATQNGCSYNR